MVRTLSALAIAIVAVSIGDFLLARGMKDIGAINSYEPRLLLRVGTQIFSHPTIIIGILCLAVFFFLWLAVLSWSELSFVLPLTALSYVLTAILALCFLGETISPLRWAGTILICLGVVLVTHSGVTPAQSTAAVQAPSRFQEPSAMPPGQSPVRAHPGLDIDLASYRGRQGNKEITGYQK